MLKTNIFSTMVFLMFSSLSIAAVNSIWDDSSGDHLWSNPMNWTLDRLPLDTDDAVYVGVQGQPSKKCVVNSGYTTPNLKALYIRPSGILDVNVGGTVLSSASVPIGSVANDANVAEFRISGGSYYGSSTDTSSPRTRVGFAAKSNGLLTITGGTYSTFSMMVPYDTTAGTTGRICLYGGTLECRANGVSGLLINYNGRTGGSMDVRTPGKLTMVGDRQTHLKNYIKAGLIFTSDPNTDIVVSFDGGSPGITTLKGVPKTDLNADGYVNYVDLGRFVQEWLTIRATTRTNPNRLIFAPAISPITVDGSFGTSEWSNASEWATFGKWYPNGQGLSSTTKARYGWNASADMLYIAIESTEPSEYMFFEVGGLMGDLATNPNSRPQDSNEATQILFQYDGTNFVITNQFAGIGGITTGIVAAHTWDGTTMRVEIATPIYSNWKNSGSKMQLTAGMDIYDYINAWNAASSGGDCQSADGVQTFFPSSIVMETGSAIRLLNSLPGTCSDFPAGMKNYADFGGDCSVNFIDFARFAQDWLK